MIDAFVTPACRLSESERDFLCANATNPDSYFHRALRDGTQAGTICLALDRGEIVGWARTDGWENWPTLEAFVVEGRRGDGIGTYCAAGLVASGGFKESCGYCAVFHPAMMKIAGRVGLTPVPFRRDHTGDWRVSWR